jgi:uncharacterized protein YlzI (FlbEa/FlbD family)
MNDSLSLDSFCQRMGIATSTARRWEKKGWLDTFLIAGRRYISRDAIEEFIRRAATGEFAGIIANPYARRKKPAGRKKTLVVSAPVAVTEKEKIETVVKILNYEKEIEKLNDQIRYYQQQLRAVIHYSIRVLNTASEEYQGGAR